MPRHFRPVGGFADFSLSHVKIDEDGHSHHVFADGKEAPAEYIADKTNIARPTWSLTELENLVRAGRWEEVTPQAEPPAAADTAVLPAITIVDADVPHVESQPQE